MLGLGAGGYVVGIWADRRYRRAPDSLLRAYGLIELAIAGLGLAVSLLLPRMGALAALTSSYVMDERGWFVLSPLRQRAAHQHRDWREQHERDRGELAHARLKPGGYLSQWLPAYQVPPETTLAMVRAFVDVFPRSVLLSGAQAELLLVGTTAAALDIDPARVAAALQRAPAVQADLQRLDLGSATEIVGMFVGSADTLARATRDASPVTDNRPLQEYAVRSVAGPGVRGVPASLFEVSTVTAWCPRCVEDGAPVSSVAGLDTYLALLDHAYHTAPSDVTAAETGGQRRLLGSSYLGAVVPDTEPVRTIVGEAYYERGSASLERGDYAQAADHLLAALQALPGSAAAHNNLGVALASMGLVEQAGEHFRRAVALDPAFEEARNNLARAGSR